MKIEFELETPNTPNFIRVKIPSSGSRQDRFKEAPMIRVGDLTDAQIIKLGQDWTNKMLELATKQRKEIK